MQSPSQRNPFRFKKFHVYQDKCAMKVGTDGVLLGAWTPVDGNPGSILDIGAGTGLIALMMAQRTHADLIDAIEIEADAYEQCVENFEASPWADRLFCYHAGLDEMMSEMEDPYELIVSNPPFHTETVGSGTEARDRARQNSALPFEELLTGTETLLAQNGVFCTIIPYRSEGEFIGIAERFGLYPFRITRVKGTPRSAYKRSLMAFSRRKLNLIADELLIELERHVYSDAYILLCQDFYLKM